MAAAWAGSTVLVAVVSTAGKLKLPAEDWLDVGFDRAMLATSREGGKVACGRTRKWIPYHVRAIYGTVEPFPVFRVGARLVNEQHLGEG